MLGLCVSVKRGFLPSVHFFYFDFLLFLYFKQAVSSYSSYKTIRQAKFIEAG